jgi:hypothetical protein
VRVEDTVVIDTEGPVVLTNHPRQLSLKTLTSR